MTAIKQQPGDRDAACARSWRHAGLHVGLYLLALAVLCHASWATMIDLWLHSSSFNHGPAAPLIAMGVAYLERRKWMAHAPVFWTPGIGIITALLIVWIFGRASDAQIIEHLTLVGLVAAGVATLIGVRAARQLAFPLSFLIFMAPFGETITPLLQSLTAAISMKILSLAGAPASLDGLIVTTPAGLFLIAPSCAGLRFVLAGVMISALFAYLAFERWRKRGVFTLAVIAAVLIANGVRVATIIAIAIATDGEAAIIDDHWALGWVFYGGVLALVAFVGAAFADKPASRRVA